MDKIWSSVWRPKIMASNSMLDADGLSEILVRELNMYRSNPMGYQYGDMNEDDFMRVIEIMAPPKSDKKARDVFYLRVKDWLELCK